MEFFLFILAIIIFDLITNRDTKTKKDISKKSTTVSSYNHTDTIDAEIIDEKSTTVNNYYTQNNIYVPKNYTKKRKKNSTTSIVKYSETGLAKKLLSDTGSKSHAKDILVNEYGYTQSTAKKLVGYNTSKTKSSRQESHTYEKWKELGYQVKRGERAAYIYYGKKMFNRSQVI